MMHARLKPFDGKKHVLRSYTVFGIKFVENRGWYKVDNDVADYLRTIKQKPEDQDSHDAFDICTEAEAKALDDREKQKVMRRAAEEAEHAKPPMRVHNVRRPEAQASAKRAIANLRANDEANDLTTDDLRGRRTVEDAIETEPAVAKDEGPVDAAPDLSGDFDDDMSATTPKAPEPKAVETAQAAEAPKATTKRTAPPKRSGRKPPELA